MKNKVEEIEVRDELIIDNVYCEKASSSMGSINASNSQFNEIKSRDNVKLTNTDVFERVEVSMGGLVWENSKKMEKKLEEIEVRDKSIMTNVSCTKITSNEINATNCELDEVIATNSVSLKNCKIIDFIEVLAGKLSAENSSLHKISSKRIIELTNSTVTSAILEIMPNEEGVIVLNKSKIEGDLVIERSSSSEFISNSSSGVSISTSGGRFKIVVGKESNLKGIKINEGMQGTINGQPYKYEKGQFVSLSGSKNSNSDEVTVRIKKGVINGNVIFKNCKGHVILEEEAQVLGTYPKN